jgi:GDP-4-dehydro-6-deoxy-D-mannose reductase
VEGRVRGGGRVFNVASGRVVTMRAVIDRLAALAGWPVTIMRDPELARANDPPVIRGDFSALHALTGWEPRFDIDRTLADLLASLA